MNLSSLITLCEVLPPGRLRLVDNRIFVGDSTWAMTQPITIAVLHHKHTKDENRAYIAQLIAIVNEARDVAAQQAAPLTEAAT